MYDLLTSSPFMIFAGLVLIYIVMFSNSSGGSKNKKIKSSGKSKKVLLICL